MKFSIASLMTLLSIAPFISAIAPREVKWTDGRISHNPNNPCDNRIPFEQFVTPNYTSVQWKERIDYCKNNLHNGLDKIRVSHNGIEGFLQNVQIVECVDIHDAGAQGRIIYRHGTATLPKIFTGISCS